MNQQNLNNEELQILNEELANSKRHRIKQMRIGILGIILGTLFGIIFLNLSEHSEFASKMAGISFAAIGYGTLVWIYWKRTIGSISRLTMDIELGKKSLGKSRIAKIPLIGKLIHLEDGSSINKSDLTFRKPKTGDSLTYERTTSGEYYFKLEKDALQQAYSE